MRRRCKISKHLKVFVPVEIITTLVLILSTESGIMHGIKEMSGSNTPR